MMPPPDPLLALFIGLGLGYVAGRIGVLVTAVALLVLFKLSGAEIPPELLPPGADALRTLLGRG